MIYKMEIKVNLYKMRSDVLMDMMINNHIPQNDKLKVKQVLRERLDAYKRHLAAATESGKTKCVVCGTTDHITKDHIVPKSKGGGNRKENLQPMCFPCNGEKGNTMPKHINKDLNSKMTDRAIQKKYIGMFKSLKAIKEIRGVNNVM